MICPNCRHEKVDRLGNNVYSCKKCLFTWSRIFKKDQEIIEGVRKIVEPYWVTRNDAMLLLFCRSDWLRIEKELLNILKGD